MSLSQLVDGAWVELSGEEHLAQCLANLVAAGVTDPCPDCFISRADGVCKPCSIQRMLSADPDYRTWVDAQARLDFGGWGWDSDRPYTYDDAKADEALVARLSAKFARAERDAKTEPNGCRHCGANDREHCQRWTQGVGWHGWVEPSNEQRLSRMYARRATSLGLPAWTRPGAKDGAR